MVTFETIFADVLALRDNDATRRLLLDAYLHGEKNGSAAGIAFAQMILDGVRDYVAYERKWKITPKT